VERYKLEKRVWTVKDFEQMGWHDCRIRAFGLRPEKFQFLVDIDYIFKWVEVPKDGQTYYNFWVAPCTLAFNNIYDLKFKIESSEGLEIESIERLDSKESQNNMGTEWLWKINCHEGCISMRSIGFEQYVRRDPMLIQDQILDLDVRGGYCLETK
jgi:hypothetical protein